MKKKLLALALVLVLILSAGSASAFAYAFPGTSTSKSDDVRYFDMTAAEFIDRFNAKYGGLGLTLLADQSHDNCWLAVNGDRTDIRIQFSDKINGPVTTGSGLDMQEWNWLYAYITTSDYAVDTQYFASLPMLCSQFAAVLGCEFTQEEFIDHCTTYGSDYPRMQYTKGGLENEIRFRDSSFGDYHQTVYSVSILLLQDAPGAEAKESEKKEASDENTLAAAANIAPEQITVPSSPEAQTYAEAERLLAAGDIAHAAMTFGRITGYKDAWERSSALWNEIARRDSFAGGNRVTTALSRDGTVLQTTDERWVDLQETTNWQNIISISAGSEHVLGVKTDGTVLACGWNTEGQCNVTNWEDIISISAGYCHSVGLKADGTVIATDYILPHVKYTDRTDVYDGQCDVQGWYDIVAVSAGFHHTVGLKQDGTVVAVGANKYGQCDVSDWQDIVAISAGRYQTIGLKKDGTVVAAGSNQYGECNVSDWKNVIDIAAGERHTVALTADGTILTAGYNDYGQCNVAEWQDVVDIGAGYFHTLGLRRDGTLLAVGWNIYSNCNVSDWHDIKVPSEPWKAPPQTPVSASNTFATFMPVGSFNYKILQNEPGYIYDKFDDYWTWYAAYDEAYTDANLLIGIQLEGEVGGSDLVGATLYTKIRNKDNRVIDGVQSMAFLVDGVKYSFPEMPAEDSDLAGSVVLYKNGYELIKAFANAKEVSVKLKLFSGGTVLLDLDSAQFDRTLGNMCRKIIQYKVWDYYIENPTVEMLEVMFPMEITKK